MLRAAAELWSQLRSYTRASVSEDTDQRLQLHPTQRKVREISSVFISVSAAYCSIPSFSQYPLTGLSGQGLGAGYNAIGAMDDTPPTWKRDKLGICRRIDSFRVERHS